MGEDLACCQVKEKSIHFWMRVLITRLHIPIWWPWKPNAWNTIGCWMCCCCLSAQALCIHQTWRTFNSKGFGILDTLLLLVLLYKYNDCEKIHFCEHILEATGHLPPLLSRLCADTSSSLFMESKQHMFSGSTVDEDVAVLTVWEKALKTSSRCEPSGYYWVLGCKNNSQMI